MTATGDALSDLIKKLAITGEKDQVRVDEDRYKEELARTQFRIFTPISDKGFFTWTPKGPHKSLDKVTSAEEIESCIQTSGMPPNLVPLSRISLPQAFLSLPPDKKDNAFPYGQLDIAALYVAAKHRGVKWSDIDFAFGGSTLEMLANLDASGPFLATVVPGTETIMVVKRKSYFHDRSEVGFQFERLVTGQAMNAVQSWEFTEHLHVMKVGKYQVLFRAEADAMKGSTSVEVKASNPQYWGTKVMFQIISNGSPDLCHGVKGRGRLQQINIRSLSNVTADALRGHDVRTLEKNILNGMNSLKDEMKNVRANEVFQISFSAGQLKLQPTRRGEFALLPAEAIVKELIL